MKRALLILALLAAACGKAPTKDKPAAELGRALFSDHTLSGSTYNRFSCATCHSTEAAESTDPLYAGGTLFDAANRQSWYLGYSSQFLDATNFCLIYFMRGEAISPGDPDGDALYEYLASISPDPNPPAVTYTFVRNISGLAPGDATAGKDVYDRACRVCHGNKDTGSGRISPETTILNATLSQDYDTLFPGTDHDLVVSEKVRHGQFYGIGGNMPFFSEEKISDAELADLEAYLAL